MGKKEKMKGKIVRSKIGELLLFPSPITPERVYLGYEEAGEPNTWGPFTSSRITLPPQLFPEIDWLGGYSDVELSITKLN